MHMGKISAIEAKRLAASKTLERKYGITLDEYDAMLESQGGVCAICGGTPNHRIRFSISYNGSKVYGKNEKSLLLNFTKKTGLVPKTTEMRRGVLVAFVVGSHVIPVAKDITIQRMAVDHDHKYKYLKIEASKAPGYGWKAVNPKTGNVQFADTRKKAVDTIKRQLKRESVRGILCFPCNGGLRKFRDNWRALRNAGKYLKKHQTK